MAAALRLPNPLHGAKGDADGLGHRAAGPVGRFTGRLGAGQRHNLVDGVGGQLRLAGFAARFPQQDIDTVLSETPLPAPDRWPADAGLPGNLMHRQSFRRKHDDPGTLNLLEGAIAVADDSGQSLAVLGIDDNADCLGHRNRIAQPAPNRNPLFASML